MGSTTLRLMTANLLHDRMAPDDLSALLERFAPDVVVTQELSPQCAPVIEGRYPQHHLRPAADFQGRGIATSFPAEFGDIAMPARDGTWALLDVDGHHLRVIGMHLANPIAFPWWRSVRHRGEQLAALFQWVDSTADDDTPLVVAGDMNASPSWPVYRAMADRWADLVARHAEITGSNPERTWSWRPGWPRMLRIDHVFGRGVESRSVAIAPVAGSDHHAVVVDIEIGS